MSKTKRNDSKGWQRGAGAYSKSYVSLSGDVPSTSKVDRSSAINSLGMRNKGLAAPVSSDRRGDKDGDRY
jgi:hypothetical protein